jgi:hypothetical protein
MKQTCRWGGRGLGTGILASLYLSTSLARAQGPAASAAASDAKPASAAAPTAKAPDSTASDADVIRLKNGGLVRGKISELIPGDSVTIVTITGKTREFPMSEVDYAGPVDADPQHPAAAGAPSASPPERAPKSSARSAADDAVVKPHVTVHAQEARLHLVADADGITFHRQAGASVAAGFRGPVYVTDFERICTAPCDASLPVGVETIALSVEGRMPVAAPAVALPPGRSELSGSYENNSGTRTAGWVVIAGSAVGGLALLVAGAAADNSTTSGILAGTGVVLGVAGFYVGYFAVPSPDKATVEVTRAAVTNPFGVARGISISTKL